MTTFKKGDRVRISGPAHMSKKWNGLLGTVTYDSDLDWPEQTEIKLDGRRPDGYDCEFFWPTKNLTRVEGELK